MAPPAPHSQSVPSLQALKAVAAAMIVLLHTTLPGQTWLLALLRTAVPIFLMISGWFAYDPSPRVVAARTRRRMRRMVWIVLWANALYVVCGLLLHLYDPAVRIPLSTAKSWVLLIFFGNGVALPLWYLTAYLETLLTLWICLRLGLGKWLVWLAPACLAANLLLGMYGFAAGCEGLPYVVKNNFITVGIPCFFTGYALRRCWPAVARLLPAARSGWVCLLLLAGAFAEMALLRHYRPGIDTDYTNATYLLSLPLAAALFVWCVHHPYAGRGVLSTAGARYATGVYLVHYLVFLVLFTCYRTPLVARWSFLIVLPCSLALTAALRGLGPLLRPSAQ